MNPENFEDLLNKKTWLKNLLKYMPSELTAQWSLIHYSPGDLVCEQDEPVRYFYILIKGEYSIESYMLDGSTLVMAQLTSGEFLSDVEIALNRQYIYTVIAASPGMAIALPIDKYWRWIQNDRHFLMNLTIRLSRKLYLSSQNAIYLKKVPIREKVISYIYDIAGKHDFEKQDKHDIKLSMHDREYLAAKWGVTVRSINRVLKSLEEENMVLLEKGKIICTSSCKSRIEKEMRDKENKDLFPV